MDIKQNPFPQWPRGLNRKQAADYIGVSLMMFVRMIADGKMPQPKRLYGRTIWDRTAVDAAFDVLDGGNARNKAGEEIYEWRDADPPTVIRYEFSGCMTVQVIALKCLYENKGVDVHHKQAPKGIGSSAFLKLKYMGFATQHPRSPTGIQSEWFRSTEAGEKAWLQILNDNPHGIAWAS